jgi:hypothetical protein
LSTPLQAPLIKGGLLRLRSGPALGNIDVPSRSILNIAEGRPLAIEGIACSGFPPRGGAGCLSLCHFEPSGLVHRRERIALRMQPVLGEFV